VIGAQAAGIADYLGRASLMRGVIPVTVQLVASAALLYAIGWRDRRWRTRRLPMAVAAGAIIGVAVYAYYGSLGLASEPAPWWMWLWVALTGFAMAIAVVGWPNAGWWRRNVAIFAASFCLLSLGLTINGWLGYFPTVNTAWNQLTDAKLPNQTDLHVVQAMQRTGAMPDRGVVVAVTTSSAASGFKHRGEWVYLPPAWFSSNRPPRLPAVLMIAAEFNTPADWIRIGNAVATLDAFAATHGGQAPVAVFADSNGAFSVDTECVDGVRGNAATHLTADVVPDIVAKFSVSADQRNWGVVGFSSGGTCALLLAVKHPDVFSTFIDIGGDLGPNAGSKSQTIDRLFGGNAEAWSAFDPSTVISRHGPYTNLSGLFAVPGQVGRAAADSLCRLGTAHGISCKVLALPGRHDWPSAAATFRETLPWVAGRLQTPGVAAIASP
jgi:S-formylglutathione hydrolase FrmB